MRGIARGLGAGLALAIVLSALPAHAAEGRIPIWQPIQIVPAPSPGFNEGKYIVTRDISANPGQSVIEIQPGTVSVDIDLNGFTLYGLDKDIIRATQVDQLTIRNGTLMFGDMSGIVVDQGRKVVIEDVKVQLVDGIGIGMGEVRNFALRRNIVVNTGGDGIFADSQYLDLSTPTQGTIEDNLIRECGRGISVWFGSSVAILNNRIEASLGDGIYVSTGPMGPPYGCMSCIIAENTIQESSENGMLLGHFEVSKVYNNTVTSSGAEGIWLDVFSDDNLILDNASSQNGSNGLLIHSNRNHVERNVLNSNGIAAGPGWGLYIQGNTNTYRGNTAQGNLGMPAACPGFGTTDFCDTGGGNVSPFNQPAAGLAGDNLMPFLL